MVSALIIIAGAGGRYPSELEVLLDNASTNQFYPVIYTAVSTGLRQAELLGLTWRSIDLDYLSISVNQVLYKRRGVCRFNEPKTSHSRCRVSMTPKLGLYLREYKKQRELLYLELGKILSRMTSFSGMSRANQLTLAH
ncbi:hypothetical protein ACFLWN_01600 [Chloroflexota bacterium]